MKILILDPERNVSHRISKDTSGGYGTGNDFGDTLIPKILKKLVTAQGRHQRMMLEILERLIYLLSYSKFSLAILF